ncbi:MAG: hypothetical protein ACYDH2_09245, partial [Anaerolineaceae bacterium]
GTISKESGYSIRIVYETPDKSAKTVESVFVQYIRFTNFGDAPITKDDSAKADPFRLEVDGDKVLDISLANVTREVCQISLEPFVETNGKTVANIHFDFLDSLDGGLIQIVTEGEKAHASLHGTLVGMPQGIKQAKREKTSIAFPDLGCLIPIIIQIGALIAVPFIYRQLNNGWENVWFLLIPVGAFILPLTITLPFLFLLTSRKKGFPDRLKPPSWYESRLYLYSEPGFARRQMERQRQNPDNNAT